MRQASLIERRPSENGSQRISEIPFGKLSVRNADTLGVVRMLSIGTNPKVQSVLRDLVAGARGVERRRGCPRRGCRRQPDAAALLTLRVQEVHQQLHC